MPPLKQVVEVVAKLPEISKLTDEAAALAGKVIESGKSLFATKSAQEAEAGLDSNFSDLTITSNEQPHEKSEALKNINKEARTLARFMKDKSVSEIEPIEATNFSTPTKVVIQETRAGKTSETEIAVTFFLAASPSMKIPKA